MIHCIQAPRRYPTVIGRMYKSARYVGDLSGLRMGRISLLDNTIYGITYEIQDAVLGKYMYPILYNWHRPDSEYITILECTYNSRFFFDPRGELWVA